MILIKTQPEIEKIREACRIAVKTLKDIEKEVRIGITTEELDRLAEEQIIKYGGQPAFKGYRGYRHTACISVNSEVVHGIPSKLKLREGDVVGFDIGAVYMGYYGDVARTFAVGKLSRTAEKLMKCGMESLEKAVVQARQGNHVGDISAAIERHAKKHGFSVVRDLFGHGVGRNLHEDPLIPNYGNQGEGPELKPGMVLAIEPMLNAGTSRIITLSDGWTIVTEDNSLSVHFENTVLVTQNDPEILTKV